jgi:hypothetical protein
MKLYFKKFNLFLAKNISLYCRVLQDRKGSPTVEYVMLIGAGALVAALLVAALDPENRDGIVGVISDKIEEIIEKATTLKENS